MVTLQSCAAGVANALSGNGEVSGSADIMVVLLLVVCSIVMIATRYSTEKGGFILVAIIFLIAALLGFSNAGFYADLNVWSGICLILGIINIITAIKAKKTE